MDHVHNVWNLVSYVREYSGEDSTFVRRAVLTFVTFVSETFTIPIL